jgi:hypothetical protein
MSSEQASEKHAEYATMYWRLNYFLCGATFFERMAHGWRVLQARPIDAFDVTTAALTLLYCLLPLLLARGFRKLLKSHLESDLLSLETYDMCNRRMPQLLFVAYVGMLAFGIRS